MAQDLETLKARIKDLEELLAQKHSENQPVIRSKIDQMSSEVVDSNPYRLERQALNLYVNLYVIFTVCWSYV